MSSSRIRCLVHQLKNVVSLQHLFERKNADVRLVATLLGSSVVFTRLSNLYRIVSRENYLALFISGFLVTLWRLKVCLHP